MAEVEIGDIVSNITADVKTIVRGELELAKAELVPSGKKAGIGGGLFGAAAVAAGTALSILLFAGAFAFAIIFAEALKWPLTSSLAMGFVCMGVVALLVAGILAMIGYFGYIKKIKGPERTIANANATVDAAKGALTQGQQDIADGRSLEVYVARRDAEISSRRFH